MMKGPLWEATTRRSLAHLSREDPSLVVVGKGIGELLREEQSSGVPAADLVDEHVTSQFRALLGDLRNGTVSTLAHVRTAIAGAQTHAARQHFDHARNRATVARLVEVWKEEASEEEIKAVRRARPEDELQIRQTLASDAFTRACVHALKGAGYDDDTAVSLATTPSVSGHHFYGLASLSLRWVHGGLDTAKDETITNDVADLDYIVTASLCRGIVSREGAVLEHDDRLRAVTRIRQANVTATVDRLEREAEARRNMADPGSQQSGGTP